MSRLLVIVPVGATSLKEVELLEHAISEVFEGLEVAALARNVAIPLSAYNWRRMQYISPKILELLLRLKLTIGANYILGICDADAYSDELNFVFGEALLGQGVAVVYLKRLRSADSRIYFARMLKESLHELGHAMGLHHCDTPGCVMNFSLSVIDVDLKFAKYCAKCAERLRNLGIKVNRDYVLTLS